MPGAVDIVCNVFTPQAVRKGYTGLDEHFKEQVRMPRAMRAGVTVAQYLRKMDRAGIERSLLIAARCGSLDVRGSFHLPYEMVAAICDRHPDRFSGLAGIDPTLGVQGLRDLDRAVREYGFVGAHWYPHWFEMPPTAARVYPYYARCVELDIPIMMQVGHNLVYSRERRLPSVGRPICLDQVAIDFPELRLIGIHIGIPWTDEMIAMAWKHPNVFIGTDAHSPKYWPESFVRYLNSYGQDKVIFGTDFPVLDFERTRAEIDALGLKPQAKRKLLRDNALRVYGLDGTR